MITSQLCSCPWIVYVEYIHQLYKVTTIMHVYITHKLFAEGVMVDDVSVELLYSINVVL